MSEDNYFEGMLDDVICIMGPTASGKTHVACELYDSNPTQYDIISVDSALVYKDMNIGTAKPTEQELAKYPHALIDIITPTEVYSAAQFATDAKALIKQSHIQGKTPILVGGTMLYYKALFGGFDDIPPSNIQIREKLAKEVLSIGIESLHARLIEIDRVSAEKLNPTDTQRIMRALEVYEISGKPLSSFQTGIQRSLPQTWQLHAIIPERTLLHERIAKRLEAMWDAGFLTEVEQLLIKYSLTKDSNAMRSVGYRQAVDYLTSEKQTNNDRQTMQDKALFATRQLAKRQCTWLRKFNKIYTINTYKSHSVALENLIK